MLKILHIQRKKTIFFSVENIFSLIRKEIYSDIIVKLFFSAYSSSGFFKRLYNLYETLFLKSDIYHILGDVHYLSLSLNSKKTILTILDCVSLHRLKGIRYYFIYFFWYYIPTRKVEYITVISNFVKQDLISFTGCDPNKISVIYCCIPEEFFSAKKKKIFNFKAPTILVVGTTENKNINRIIKSIKNIKSNLIIVGKLSKIQLNQLNKSEISYKNYSNLSVDQLIEKYIESDILLFPSLYEGFGLPIIEANALGIPVITSNICSMPEVASDAALLVNPYSVSEITNAINKLLINADIRNKIIKNGFKNCKRFTGKLIANEYRMLYKKVSNK